MNDRFTSLQISGANVVEHVLMTDVGILSSGDDLHGIELISFWTSSTVVGGRLVNSGPACLESDCSGSSTLSPKRVLITDLMSRILSTKNVSNCRPAFTSVATGGFDPVIVQLAPRLNNGFVGSAT